MSSTNYIRCSICNKIYYVFPREMLRKSSHRRRCYACDGMEGPPSMLGDNLYQQWETYFYYHPDKYLVDLVRRNLNKFTSILNQVEKYEKYDLPSDIIEKVELEGGAFLYWIKYYYDEFIHLDILSDFYESPIRR